MILLTSATPAGRGTKGSASSASFTPEQITAASYDGPTPSAAWMRPYYICACGFECVVQTDEAFKWKAIPHPCRLRP